MRSQGFNTRLTQHYKERRIVGQGLLHMNSQSHTGCMKPVEIWNEKRRGQHEEQYMTKQEVGTPKTEFNNLDHEFSSGLRHDSRPQAAAVPLASPPSTIGLVVLELTRKEYRNENFVHGSLNRYHRNETKYSV